MSIETLMEKMKLVELKKIQFQYHDEKNENAVLQSLAHNISVAKIET